MPPFTHYDTREREQRVKLLFYSIQSINMRAE